MEEESFMLVTASGPQLVKGHAVPWLHDLGSDWETTGLDVLRSSRETKIL